MITAKIDSPEGCYDEQYFVNTAPLAEGDLIGSGASFPVRNHGWWNMGKLWHFPYYTLSLMLEGGSGYYRDENGFECQLGYGDVLLTTPDFGHLCGPGKNEQWSNIYVSFTGELFDLYLKAGVLNSKSPAWRVSDPGAYIVELRELLMAPCVNSQVSVALRATALLHLILRVLGEGTPLVSTDQTTDWFSQACILLVRDMHHKLDLHAVADELGMSYHTFRLYFTRRAGMTPQRYRDQKRIEAACDMLLKNPGKSCQAISFILGYCNGDHFSTHFKKHMGISPGQYRKKHLGKSKTNPTN